MSPALEELAGITKSIRRMQISDLMLGHLVKKADTNKAINRDGTHSSGSVEILTMTESIDLKNDLNSQPLDRRRTAFVINEEICKNTAAEMPAYREKLNAKMIRDIAGLKIPTDKKLKKISEE
jgi:hypothetical protein